MRSYGADEGISSEIQKQTLPYVLIIAYKFKVRKLTVFDPLLYSVVIRIQTDTPKGSIGLYYFCYSVYDKTSIKSVSSIKRGISKRAVIYTTAITADQPRVTY